MYFIVELKLKRSFRQGTVSCRFVFRITGQLVFGTRMCTLCSDSVREDLFIFSVIPSTLSQCSC